MKGRSVCGYGHDLTAPSSRLSPDNGRALGPCRQCRADQQRERHHGNPRSKQPPLYEPAPPGTKRCSVCHEVKVFDLFYRDRNGSNGVATVCKDCAKIQRKRAYHADPERHKLRVVAKRYGVPEAQILELRQKQGDVCAICNRVNANGRALSVDHSHKTGQVRGLLCGPCNFAIGLFQEHPGLLDAAAEYLRTHHPEVSA